VTPESRTAPIHTGRPRQADLDRRLETTALALLHDHGPGAVTVERVAATSGVAKTSIYRRYANRRELLTAVMSTALGAPEVPDDGTAHDKLRSALEQTWRQMSDVLGPGGLAAMVGNSDPEFTELFRAALRPYDEALVDRIRSDSDEGLLQPDVDADGIVSLMIGAYVGELVRRGHVAPGWLDRSMELIWATMARP
jgi:AcrR family transcriptional regulator